MGNQTDSLAVINSEIVSCNKCDRLVEWRSEVARTKRKSYEDQEYWGKGVTGFGDSAAELVIVGLAPGAHGANRTGRVFTGDRSGDWLYSALHRAGFANQPESTSIDDGLTLTNAYITMPVRCVPPGNKPIAAEVKNCVSYLQREIEILKPKVILALGSIAFNKVQDLYGVKPRIKFAHGESLALKTADDSGGPTKLLACYHVSQQNTFTGRLTEEMLDNVFSNINKLLSDS